MNLLFDALKRAQDTDDAALPKDGPCIDLSEPEVTIQSTVHPVEELPDLKIRELVAASFFADTAQQSRRIVSALGLLFLLLLAGGGGFWYYKRTMTTRLLPAASIYLPPPPTTAAAVSPPQLAAESQTFETPALTNAEEIAPDREPLPPAPPAKIPEPETTIAAAEISAERAGAGLQQNLALKTAPASNRAAQTAASLKPFIAQSERSEGLAAAKEQLPSRPPEHPQQGGPPENDRVPSQKPLEDTAAADHIRLNASSDPLRLGYQALIEGRMDDAARLYQEVLNTRPQERDALLGLAVIAHRQRQLERAVNLYRQVLREDPGNATAAAALLNLSAQVEPVDAENRLKQLLEQNPASPALHHALGSLLARQKRWEEAQQALFQAYRLEPGNAFYAYNLAVALDQLHKPAAALAYYEKAAQIITPGGDVAIDRDTIQRRVQELRRILPEQR